MLELVNLNITDLCMKVFVMCIVLSCKNIPQKQEAVSLDMPFIQSYRERSADTLLTPETRALLINLKRMQGRCLLFGHQDATIMNVHAAITKNVSDVKEVTGAYPSIY